MASAVADHGEIDEGLVVAWIALMIAHQSARLDQPAEGALNDPAPGQQDEALGLVAALDDREHQPCRMPKGLRCGGDKAFELSGIAAIGKNDAQAQEQGAEDAEHDLGGIAILHARRRDYHAQEQPLSVGENVAFATFDLLARIVAAAAGCHGVSALHALAVDDRGAGRGVFFSPTRRRSRNAVLIRSHKPLLIQRVKASCTVVRGGYSLGNMRHWQPVLSK